MAGAASAGIDARTRTVNLGWALTGPSSGAMPRDRVRTLSPTVEQPPATERGVDSASSSRALDLLPVLQPIGDQLDALPIVASIEDGQVLRLRAQVDADGSRVHLHRSVRASLE